MVQRCNGNISAKYFREKLPTLIPSHKKRRTSVSSWSPVRVLSSIQHFCSFQNFTLYISNYFIVTKSLKAKFHISHARKYALSCSKQSFLRFCGVHDFRQRYIWWETKSWNPWCHRSYKGSIYSYFCFQEWSFRWIWRSVLISRSHKVLRPIQIQILILTKNLSWYTSFDRSSGLWRRWSSGNDKFKNSDEKSKGQMCTGSSALL